MFLILAGLLFLLSYTPSAESSGRGTVLSDRRGDFLEIRGDRLPSLLGQPLARLELLAVRGRSLEPVPFQVDERAKLSDDEYAWVLPQGPKGSKVKGNGILDKEDEFVFMALDLGEKAGEALLADLPALPRRAVEIQVTDPVSGKTGYAYLGTAKENPRRSKTDYVTYDVNRDFIDTPVYSVGHSLEFPIAHNENTIKAAAGGEGLDITDIFKQRMFASAFFGKLKVDKRAKDWTSEISAYKDGPVRVIRKNENRLFISKKIKSPRLYTHTFYYRDLFFLPGEMDVPFKLSWIITSLDITLATDFCRNAVGMEFSSNTIDPPVLIDGVLSPREVSLDRQTNQAWQMVHGPQGTWFNRIVVGPGLEKVLRGLFYDDNALQPDPPEEEEGIIGKVGLSLGNLEKLKGGQYTFCSYIHFPEHFEPGHQTRLLNLLDHPLQIKTLRLEAR